MEDFQFSKCTLKILTSIYKHDTGVTETEQAVAEYISYIYAAKLSWDRRGSHNDTVFFK